MSEIKYLQHHQIEKDRWDNVIANAPNSTLYAYSWYLDIVCDGRWDALVLGEYEAVFPLPWRKKWGVYYIYQPFFCQQLGLFGKLDLGFNQDAFLQKIPRKFKKIHLQLNGYFPVSEFLKQRPNYILSLKLQYAELRTAYKKDAVKNLKKTRDKPIVFREDIGVVEVLHKHRKTWGDLNPGVKDNDYLRFQKLCIAAAEKNCLLVIAAQEADVLLGTAIFMRAGERLHYLISGPTEQGRKLSIMHAIMDYVIQKYAGSDLTLDFEGSEIQEVAAFYEKWGAQRTLYYTIYKIKW